MEESFDKLGKGQRRLLTQRSGLVSVWTKVEMAENTTGYYILAGTLGFIFLFMLGILAIVLYAKTHDGQPGARRFIDPLMKTPRDPQAWNFRDMIWTVNTGHGEPSVLMRDLELGAVRHRSQAESDRSVNEPAPPYTPPPMYQAQEVRIDIGGTPSGPEVMEVHCASPVCPCPTCRDVSSQMDKILDRVEENRRRQERRMRRKEHFDRFQRILKQHNS